jgi:hypothetical protein
MDGKYLGVALPGKNAAHDLKPGGAGEVANHRVEHNIHLS